MAPRRWTLTLALCVVACGDGRGATDSGGGSSDDGGTSTGAPEPAPDEAECAAVTVPSLDAIGAQQIERVATREQIPGLADQPSTHGQILGSLFAFDGRLHLGYGDYSDNTGPIAMPAWDPGSSAFVDMGTLPTEEVLWFRRGEGTLYTPAIDPDGHQEDGGIYRLDCGADTWHVGTPIPGAVHVYDVALQGDAIYVGTGSVEGQPAWLMSSTDHGESWTEEMRHESPPGRFSRIYFLGATSDELFASGREHPDPDVALAWIRRGDGDFEALVDPPTGSLVPIVLDDHMIVTAFSGNPGRGTYLGSHAVVGDGFEPREPWPEEPDGARLVAWTTVPAQGARPERMLVAMRTDDGSTPIYQSADLTAGPAGWDRLLSLPPLLDDEYVSMALLLGDLYLGTKRGELWVVRELEPPAP